MYFILSSLLKVMVWMVILTACLNSTNSAW